MFFDIFEWVFHSWSQKYSKIQEQLSRLPYGNGPFRSQQNHGINKQKSSLYSGLKCQKSLLTPQIFPIDENPHVQIPTFSVGETNLMDARISKIYEL